MAYAPIAWLRDSSFTVMAAGSIARSPSRAFGCPRADTKSVNILVPGGSNSQDVNSQTCEIGVVRQLFDRCVTGDRQAWRDLHRTYHPVACRFLTRMGVQGPDLEDACQEVFVQVFRYLARFQHRADFQTWLYKLCLSQSNRLRRRRKVHQALGWLVGRAGLAKATSQEWSDAMTGERVRQALDRMKPLHRQVFVLFELEGVDGDEIARVLDCPAATVRRRLHYARLEFEKFLGEGPDGERRGP